MWAKISRYRQTLRDSMHIRYALANLACGLFPDYISGVVRGRLYRLCGLRIAPSAFIMSNLYLTSAQPGFYDKLSIGPNVQISTQVTINLDAAVTIEENVTIGPFVRIYTGTHDVGPASFRCLPEVVAKPVIIERGSWVAVGATILPGVRIGQGSVISAGAVVATDIAPNSYVAGVPARAMRVLPEEMTQQ